MELLLNLVESAHMVKHFEKGMKQSSLFSSGENPALATLLKKMRIFSLKGIYTEPYVCVHLFLS